MFSSIVIPLTELLKDHHNLYESPCNSLQWEELCSKSLNKAGFGSDWRPNTNHKSLLDQTTDFGIRIGNKAGEILNMSDLKFSGSRLGSHSKLSDKLDFLSSLNTDYIFFLSRNPKEWPNKIKKILFYCL